MSHDKRVALVTGGIGGIGTEICKRLAQGTRTVVAGHLPSEQAQAEQWQSMRRTEGLEIELIDGDVGSFDSSAEMVRHVRERFGEIDILVNCAGITRDKTLRKMEPDHWNAVLTTNLDSVFNVTRQVVESMMAQGFGRIINISSVNGQKGMFGQTNYSAAKAGVHGFSMHAGLGRGIVGLTEHAFLPVDGRYINNAAEPLRHHALYNLTGNVEHAV